MPPPPVPAETQLEARLNDISNSSSNAQQSTKVSSPLLHFSKTILIFLMHRMTKAIKHCLTRRTIR